MTACRLGRRLLPLARLVVVRDGTAALSQCLDAIATGRPVLLLAALSLIGDLRQWPGV
jgi:hypothetical protein